MTLICTIVEITPTSDDKTIVVMKIFASGNRLPFILGMNWPDTDIPQLGSSIEIEMGAGKWVSPKGEIKVILEKDGKSFRHQFGPEDFEDEHDARERQAIERDNERRAELLRVGLKRFERNFDIRVSNDARSGAMCYHCKELFTGNRSKPTLLARLLTTHTRSCTAAKIKPAFAAPYLAFNMEEVFS